MLNVDFIVPYKKLVPLVEKELQTVSLKEICKINIFSKTIEEVKKIKFTSDIIVARGLMASYLKNHYRNTSIIEISISSYDIIHTAIKAMNTFNVKKIAYFTSSPHDLIDMDFNNSRHFPVIDGYTIDPGSDLKQELEKAVKNGAEVILGGDRVFSRAKKLDIPAILIETGIYSVKRTFHEIDNLIRSNFENQSRIKRLRALVDNVQDCIISFDHDLKINIFNNEAEKLLNIKFTDIIGRRIDDFLPFLGPENILNLKTPLNNKYFQYKKLKLIVNIIPILVDNRFTSGIVTLQSVSNIQKIESDIRRISHKKGLIAKNNFQDILGESEEIKKTIKKAGNYSKTNSNILLVGETGTGKEMFAQSIHNNSQRKDGPFVAINCAALSESILESELFGYVGGSFTGASKDGKMGLFELAHRGTIFLDEISEVSKEIQSRLLRVLEEREIMRIGGTKVIPIDIRIISATNKNLKNLVEKNEFRKDLFYRLDVLRLNIPPLRERGRDSLYLFNHYLRIFEIKNNMPFHKLSEECIDRILKYYWDGNIRQLRNFCERLSVDVDAEIVELNDIEGFFDEEKSKDVNSFDSMEKKEIKLLMNKYKTKKEIAESLQINRTTLYRKMKKYNLL